MNINDLIPEMWDGLTKVSFPTEGYNGRFINLPGHEKSELLVFKDESGFFHLVIENETVKLREIKDPNVNGLKVNLKTYSFKEVPGETKFIDIECSNISYTCEFTEVVKEIAEKILIEKIPSVRAIEEVIYGWKSFWGDPCDNILSKEEQVGLLCELTVLKELCEFEPQTALNSWKGPLKALQDFIFSEWALEIKGTRKNVHIHTINGLDQLLPPYGKSLAVISFLCEMGSDFSLTLPGIINELETNHFGKNNKLKRLFYFLLGEAGYRRIYAKEYEKYKFKIYDGLIYKVDNSFPSLTSENLLSPLDSRISKVRYELNLEGLTSYSFNNLSVSEFF
jgi:hypothetical protein